MKIKIYSIDKFKQKYDKIFDIAQTNHLDGKNEYHYNDEFGRCRIIEHSDFVEILSSWKNKLKTSF